LHVRHIVDIHTYIYIISAWKKDCKTAKDVPRIGLGFNNFIAHPSLFWFLPFASMKQDYAVLDESADVTIGNQTELR
jgi:hypothetical protein